MTRILVITNQYPPHHLGGYELSCRDVVDRWRRRGHDVQVLTGDWKRPGVADPVAEPQVARQLTMYLRDGSLWSPPLHRRLGIERRNEEALRGHLARRPDVISVWHMGALPTGLLKLLADSGIATVFVVCDDWPTYAFGIDPWMRLWRRHRIAGRLAGRLLRVATEVPDMDRAGSYCFVSDTTRSRCRRHSPWRFPRSTITFSGIDPEDFPVLGPGAARPGWDWRLLAVGRLDPRKGFETAIRAVAQLPLATLDIFSAGDDPYRGRLEGLASQLGVAARVRFGSADRAELAQVYRAADAVLFTPEWDEPFGLVPVEAMACATPVVTTAAGGSAEFLVDGVNCLRVAPGDPTSLAAGVRRLADEPDLRRALVAAGCVTAADYGVDRLADRLERWHLAAAGKPRPAPVLR